MFKCSNKLDEYCNQNATTLLHTYIWIVLEQHDACGMHWYVQDVFDYQIKIFLAELLNLTTFEKLLKNNSKTTSPNITA